MGRLNAGWMALRPGLVRFGRHVRRVAAAYGVLLIALLLTLLASYYVRQNVEAEARTRFDETTQATKAAIYRRVNAYLAAMFGARGLLRESGSVEREEWDGYVRSIEPGLRRNRLRKAQSLEGLQSLGFATYLRPGERETYSREAREEGVPDLRPEPDGERSAYFPLKFVGPSYEANRKMINYDAYSDPAHRSVMDRARDTGEPQATGMDYVLTNAPSHSEADLALRKGFVVYLPVYQEGESRDTVAERRRALRGFIVGTFKAEELFAHTFGRTFHPAIDFEVYDGQDVASSSLLYDNNGVRSAGEKGDAALFSEENRMRVIGTQSGTREWSLYFATLPGFDRGAKSNLPAFVLVSGVSVSLLLFGITWMLARSRTQAFRASADLKEANRELEQANTELQRSREGLVSTREEERRRLRRDLHDGVGPQLAALMLELETASDLVSDNPEASALMAKLSKRAREIVSDVRHSVHALRPPALDELGLVEALREGAIQYGPAGLRVSVENPEELSHLPAAVEVACYRIAQEALANVVRHARASHCSIRIRLDEEAGALSIEVEDDGRGIRDDDSAGVGMISMRERTEELGGWCTVKSVVGGGTLVRALLPFQTKGEASLREELGSMEDTVRVLIADDHPLFREGMRSRLDRVADVAVVGEAASGDEAVELAHKLEPDVILMDIKMPGLNGIEATREIQQASPRIGVLVLTMFEDDDSVFAAMRAGAKGYLLKDSGGEGVVHAIRAVASGEAVFGPRVAERIIGFFSAPRAAAPQRVFPVLTEREEEVLSLVAQGKSNREIARQLFVSLKTVRNHVSNILLKLQVADRAQAVIRARDAGMGRDGV